MLSQSDLNQIKPLFLKANETNEFEVMFNNYKSTNKLSITKFMSLLKYAKYKSIEDNLIIKQETILDAIYTYDTGKAYRASITGIDKINDFLNLTHQRNNNIIFSILTTQYYEKEGYTFINKKKNQKNIIDFDNYDIRVRLNEEEPITQKEINLLTNIQYSEINKIYFRYKQRVSLHMTIDDNNEFRLDMTIVKGSSIPDKIHDADKEFEVELEYITKKKPTEKLLSMLNDKILLIKQILENSKLVLSRDESNNIISNYKKLFLDNTEELTNLYSMQPISAEVQHIVEKLHNVYSVSDKADGDKYQLLVFNGSIYLLSNNLVIRKTQYEVKNLGTTLIEGELIHNNEYNCYIYMMFDCLYYNGVDVRSEPLLINRLTYIDKFLKQLSSEYVFNTYTDNFDLNKQEKFYENEIIKYYKHLNKLLEKSKMNDIIFYKKVFLFPLGGDNCEVFSLSNLMWNCLTNNMDVKCPYLLDGIIYTGIEQKYSKNKRDQKYPIYKYKPPTTNSIDVYVTYQYNETGGYVDFFDNTISNTKNTIYRIVNFSVGDYISDKEVPILFMKEENNHEAFFPLDKGEIRDVEGNLVTNNSVIEVIYVNDLLLPHQYRWKILRTRWIKQKMLLEIKNNMVILKMLQ